MVHIITKVPRPTAELIQAFAEQSTATVHEAMGRRGAIHSSIKPLAPGMRLCGPALTVQSQAGDNLTLLKALDMAPTGDVIVADMGQTTESGPWGEITTLQAQVRGLGGLVTNGSVRDSAAIRKMGFPVFSKAVCIKGTAKESLGYINHPITCGDAVVNPGDIILGDDDGVVVIPLAEAEAVLEESRKRDAKEAAIMERIRNGESFFTFSGYPEVLRRKGYIEEEEQQ